jgi:hypothetical protein
VIDAPDCVCLILPTPPVPFGGHEAAPASALRAGALSGSLNADGVFDAPDMVEVYAVGVAQ